MHNDGRVRQEGFVLIIAMVVLVLMTGTALPMFKTAFIQEKVSSSSKAITADMFDAETSVAQQEDAFASLADLSGEELEDLECGIKMIEGFEGGAKIRTFYYNPPPNGFNWGDGSGHKVAICHKYDNDLSVSINAVGDDAQGHMQHEGDYLGNCVAVIPDDPWTTCIEKYGDQPRRLSWIQYYE